MSLSPLKLSKDYIKIEDRQREGGYLLRSLAPNDFALTEKSKSIKYRYYCIFGLKSWESLSKRYGDEMMSIYRKYTINRNGGMLEKKVGFIKMRYMRDISTGNIRIGKYGLLRAKIVLLAYSESNKRG